MNWHIKWLWIKSFPDNQTIRYKKQQDEVQDDGSTKTGIIEVEKQTTPDRLELVEWNEEKSWRILQ